MARTATPPQRPTLTLTPTRRVAQAGSITLDGVQLSSLDARWVRESFGYVSQSPAVLSGSIRDNIAYACPNATDQQVRSSNSPRV